MNRPRGPSRRRGLALVELLIGIAITAIIGLAVATTLISVGEGLTHSREARSALQRAFTAHTRLRAYFDPGLCVLEDDPNVGFAFWLHDGRANDACNLLELRVFWYNPDAGTVSVEWVEFPEEWDDVSVAAADIALPGGTDYFQIMKDQRVLGYTDSTILVDGIGDIGLTYDPVSVLDADRLRLSLQVMLNDDESHDLLFALAMPNHRIPV